MTDFYAQLPLAPRFSDVADLDRYAPAPADWWVVISDVQGSTQAIEAGRYRQVNVVGAITIAAALNAVGRVEIPFVFGGDGATLLVPPSCQEAVKEALLGVQATAQHEFALKLRVGLMPLRDVYAAGHQVLIGKVGISPHYAQAMFTGGGLAYAEAAIKHPAAGRAYRVEGPAQTAPDYTGVECRWTHIASAHGETVSLLVAATNPNPEEAARTYRAAIETIEHIYGSERVRHPVRIAQLRPSFDPAELAAHEPRVRRPAGWRRWWYVAKIWMQQVLLLVFIRFNVRTGDTVWRRYLPTLQQTTDVKKFDEMLRMVLAGTAAQREHLEAYLDAEYQAGRLAYGLHVADSAVMTCLVYERLGRQVHFVDGARGGYAMAAKALKQRLRTAGEGFAPSYPAGRRSEASTPGRPSGPEPEGRVGALQTRYDTAATPRAR
ncbi:MAG: DUF3095 domain-containing protein [Bacteroidota bacterium]